MRADEADWAEFYAGERGAIVRLALGSRLRVAWGSTRGASVLGLGYAGPHLANFDDARRVISAGPYRGGGDRRVRVALHALPFADASFDRVLLVHALEECEDAAAALREAARVLASSGRMLVAATARSGLWARFGRTPLRRGRSWGGGELAHLLRLQGLEITARTRLLHTPPIRGLGRRASALEHAGSWLWPGIGGLVVVEATRRDFIRPRLRRARVGARRPVLAPVAAPTFQTPARTC